MAKRSLVDIIAPRVQVGDDTLTYSTGDWLVTIGESGNILDAPSQSGASYTHAIFENDATDGVWYGNRSWVGITGDIASGNRTVVGDFLYVNSPFINYTGGTVDFYGIYANTQPGCPARDVYGAYISVSADSASTESVERAVAVRGVAQIGHFADFDLAIGVEAAIYGGTGGTHTATDVRALQATVVQWGTDQTVTSLRGLSISGWDTTPEWEPIPNAYGIYIDDTIKTNATTHYAIYSLSTSPSVLTGSLTVPTEAYDATGWDGNFTVPTKDAIRDKIESMAGGSPGGSDTQVQFNDGGVFGGDAGLTYNKTTDVLTINTIPFGKGTGTNSIKIGTGTTATSNDSVAIGRNSDASGANGAVSIGTISEASGSRSVAVGISAVAENTDTLALGYNVTASGVGDTAVGVGADASGGSAVSIGNTSTAAGLNSVALGVNTYASADNSVAVGPFAISTFANSMGLGKDASTTATNQIVFGADTNDNTGFSELWWGQSVVSSQASPFTINVTRRSGLNQPGNDFTIRSGLGTGNSTTGGDIIFQTPNTIGSSSTAQTPTTRLTIGRDNITSTLDVIVPDEAYDATNWNGSLEVPTKNAVRDKFESLSPLAIGSTITSATEGSVLFAGASGVLAQDNSNFFWNDTANQLLLGTTTLDFSSAILSKHLQIGGTAYVNRTIGTHYNFASYAYVNGSTNNLNILGGNVDVRYQGTGTGVAVNGLDILATTTGTSGASSTNAVRAFAGASTNGGTVTTANAVLAEVRAFNGGTVTTGNFFKTQGNFGTTGAVGTLYGLNLSGWGSNGTISTSYGIYADTSIDRGSTKYFIYSLSTSPSLFTGTVEVPDDAYDATSWNGNNTVPTKNAVRDKIESLSAGSGITRTVVVTSGSATMGSTASIDYVYFVVGAHTMSLPAASGNTNRYTVKNNHSANITIDTAGSETIEGSASISIAPEEAVDILSDGTNWWIV